MAQQLSLMLARSRDILVHIEGMWMCHANAALRVHYGAFEFVHQEEACVRIHLPQCSQGSMSSAAHGSASNCSGSIEQVYPGS